MKQEGKERFPQKARESRVQNEVWIKGTLPQFSISAASSVETRPRQDYSERLKERERRPRWPSEPFRPLQKSVTVPQSTTR